MVTLLGKKQAYFLCGFGLVSSKTTAIAIQTKTLTIMKKFVNEIIYFSSLFERIMLATQHKAISISPNTSTNTFVLSIPCTTGVSTITARNTWPALSQMFANRSICEEVNSYLLDNTDVIDYDICSIAQQGQRGRR